MTTALIGERLNLPGGRRALSWDRYAYSEDPEDLERWIRISLRVGMFRSDRGSDPRSRARLASIEGLPAWQLSLNLLPPAPAGEWTREDRRAADRIAGFLWETRVDWTTWLLVGRRVAMSFGSVAANLDYCEPHLDEATGCTMIVVPHPSGRSRVWCDPEAGWRDRMRVERRNFRELRRDET
jgi:hypothetical protein